MKKLLFILAILTVGCTAEDNCQCEVVNEHYTNGLFIYKELANEQINCFDPYREYSNTNVYILKRCFDPNLDVE